MPIVSKFLTAALCLANLASAWKTISVSEWSHLNDKLEGSVILPTDEDYDSEYVLWASTFDYVYPEAIIECSTHEDVVEAYNFLLSHYEEGDIDNEAKSIKVRCGKHNMIGASTTDGIIIDVGNLQGLDVTTNEEGEEIALVEPGVNLSQFTAWAEENDVTLPHGDCASVTFGGFLLGGGLGLTSRTFGLAGDWVASVRMVLADGSVVRARADNEYADLFWATIGGGGGNFGIVTQYEMNIPEKKQVNPGLYVEMTWEYSYETWQLVSSTWKQFMNDESLQNHFAMYLRIQPADYLTQDYYVGLHGFWTGEQTTGLLILAEVLTEINLTPASAKIDYVHFEGWIESSASDRVRYSSQCKSRWALDELEAPFFDTLGSAMEDLIAYKPSDEVQEGDDDSYVYPTQFMFISPADGTIATGPSGRNTQDIAFVHRDKKYFFAMCGRWRYGYENAQTKMQAWLKKTVDDLEQYLSTYSFVSFPDWDLKNWHESYYGDNYAKLQEVKAKYDPNYIWRYSQSIVPAGWTGKTSDKEFAPVEEAHGETKRGKWEREQKELAAANVSGSNVFSFDWQSVEMWSFIAAGVVVGLLLFRTLFAKKGSKGEYAPLKEAQFESADETERVVIL